MPHVSATLTVWAAGWLHGSAAPDDVIDALHSWAESHDVSAADDATAEVLDLPTSGGSVVDLLSAARRAGARRGHLLLPVPGDVRGLPPHPDLTAAAVGAGELAVLAGGGVDLLAVPSPVTEGLLRWTVFAATGTPPADEPLLAEAEHGLRGAVRQAASALVDLDIARHRPGVRAEIAGFLEQRVRPPWPDGTPGRALRVLEQADEVEAILRAAEHDTPGGALSASAASARSDVLRPLFTAVREARRSAIGEAVRYALVSE